jgi:hypothetical protein
MRIKTEYLTKIIHQNIKMTLTNITSPQHTSTEHTPIHYSSDSPQHNVMAFMPTTQCHDTSHRRSHTTYTNTLMLQHSYIT